MEQNVLLMLLPFWDPQIPPMGLASLKGYLERHGYRAKTIDANVEPRFRNMYHRYLGILEKYTPPEKQGNLFNHGEKLMGEHLTAHFNRTGEADYMRLLKLLIEDKFFFPYREEWIRELDGVIGEFFVVLEDYIIKVLEEEKPGVLGFSTFSGTLAASLYAARLAKQTCPAVKTVIGGGIFSNQFALGSADLDFLVEKTGQWVDHFIAGEGEVLLLKLLKGELPDSTKIFSRFMPGLEPLDLDRAALPDFSGFKPGHYPYLGAYSSRSCPFQCTFCSDTVNWGAFRAKKAHQTAAELIQLSRRYSYQLFLFTDSLLNHIVGPLSEELIRADAPVYWGGYLRADKPACDTSNTLNWRRGGFYAAKLGLESGSARILELMGKKITPDQIRQTLFSLAYAGIKTTTYWVIGYPGETEDDFQQTLDLLALVKDDIYEADFNPFFYHPNSLVETGKPVPVYPSWAGELLMYRDYRLDAEPSWQETLMRGRRFTGHCRNLGIPNPYTIDELNRADERWRRLHKNAVPPLISFRDPNGRIDEKRNIKNVSCAENTMPDEGDWL